MANTLKTLQPEQIEPNSENPREHFREREMQSLAESIDSDGGVLVPLYVFPHATRTDHYVLIDGERRWKVAIQLGLDAVPAIVRDREPDPADNLVEMFNIHHVREAWEEMPTARALQAVMVRKKTQDVGELSRITGLSREQIGRYHLVLDLPKRYQQLIEDRTIPMNFFVELERNIIKPLAASRQNLAKEFSAAKLRKAFVDKRSSGALQDLVDMRDVRKIIGKAAADAGGPNEDSGIDNALRRLFTEKSTTIDEIYEATVAFEIEAGKLATQAERLTSTFGDLLRTAKNPEERFSVLTCAEETRQSLDDLIDIYGP